MDALDTISKISAALEPWVIGSLGIYIAINQWRTSRRQAEIAGHRLKYDLFDKRFAVYAAARTLFADINERGIVDGKALNQYFLSIREAKWILNDEINEYLSKEVISQVTAIRLVEGRIQRLQDAGRQEELSNSLDKQMQLYDWLYAQMDVLDTKFEPFLRVQH